MNIANNRSLMYLLFGALLGSCLGIAAYLWTIRIQTTSLDNLRILWVVVSTVWIGAIAGVFGAVVGVAVNRLIVEIKAGTSVLPHLKSALYYAAGVLIVLLFRGNRDPLDLIGVPILGAIAGLVLSCTVSEKTVSKPASSR